MLLVLALCLGLTSGGRLSGCLLPTPSADLAAAEVNPAAPEFTPEDPGINPADSEIISEDTEINPAAPQIIPSGPQIIPSGPQIIPSGTQIIPSGPPTVAATGLIPLSPAGLSQGAGRPPPFLPAPVPVPVRAQEAGRRTSFFSSLPVSGGVSVGSFSSVGSFHGPQGGFHSAQGGFHGPQGSFHSAQGGFHSPQGGFVQLSAPLVGLQVGYSGAHLSPPAVVCLNWCLDPTGNYFCCRYTGGQCPRVPDVCQTGSAVNRLPNCASDASCGFGFKCCFDRCQEQFVCKAAVAA
ncbi:splicing factor 3A subunit 2-like [Amphibalanus amphitrite]|uniref:splicing factor 3A subunit 2-like n=1 Tax=Amphibalanus amphitrite TaxID=1232801 RepID=UPI001C8FE2A6|nr:splicing factor 3A subunit 2-like [Amphibalanus amphitrite]